MNRQRNLQIDALRSFALFLVFSFHAFYHYNNVFGFEKNKVLSYFGISHWGFAGVSVFMIISAIHLFPSQNTVYGVKYLIKKQRRIWPLYFISITIIFALLSIPMLYLPDRQVNFAEYLLNIPYLNGFIGTRYVDGAHWYLTVLLSFHLVFAVITLIKKYIHKLNPYIFLCVWMLLGFALKMFFKIGFNFVGGEYIGVAVLGVCLGIFSKDKDERKNIFLYIVSITGVLFTFFCLGKTNCIIVILAVILCYLALNEKIPIICNKVTLSISKVSYVFYLLHQNIMYSILYNFTDKIGFWGSLFIALLIIILLTIFIHVFIENRLFKKLGIT